jgi:hypothetical protein
MLKMEIDKKGRQPCQQDAMVIEEWKRIGNRGTR